ncbi:MAG: CoA-binding protein [Acidimicrobiales bacterium]
MIGPQHFEALFAPRGVVVAGAASHPGKFGFSAFHNIRANGYAGSLYGTNLDAEPVLGEVTYTDISSLPDDDLDLVVLCVPGRATEALLRQAADRGIRAAFSAAAGYAESGPDGRRAQDELVELADELDMLLVGPNGQGLISTPSNLCAQIVAPYPPAGSIGIASQSGGLVSAFGNWARLSGTGVSRAVSAGNSAQVGVIDFLEYYATDPATDVGLVYLEDISDDRLFDRLADVSRRMPVVALRGGATGPVERAIDAHTGARSGTVAEPDRALAEAGVAVARSVPEAFRLAATFATQPLPKGPRTVVFGTAGGWGVLTADAVVTSGLELAELPDDLVAEVDARVPPRWSRGNPIDLAGGETRDTVPELLPLLAGHDAVDAIVYLGLGIQSNQAELLRGGGYAESHGLERIITYHERQDSRFARAAHDASEASGKPVLTSTELALTMPHNAGPTEVRASGRFCHSSGDEAVSALAALWRYAQWCQVQQ